MKYGARIAGMTRLTNHPLHAACALALAQHCDDLVLGFDFSGTGGYGESGHLTGPELYDWFRLARPWPAACRTQLVKCEIPAGCRYLGDDFLEEMVRHFDGIDPAPDILLHPDADETFGDGFEEDLRGFIEGGADWWVIPLETVTNDGRWAPPIPAPHTKASRYYPGIRFGDWWGFCTSQPRDKRPGHHSAWTGQSVIQHWYAFTEGLEAERWRYYGWPKTKAMWVDQGGAPEVPERVRRLFDAV